jgi:hypothetical protein
VSLSGWEVQRYRAPGVTPLEVWNLPVQEHELWELLSTPRLEQDRRAGVPEDALVSRMLPVLTEALRALIPRHRVDSVFLSGGLLALEGFQPALARAEAALPCPIYVAREPRFAATRAGLRLLEDLRPTSPLSVDVGQTSIKAASPSLLHVAERDTVTMPRLFIGMPRPADERHVSAAVRFIAEALRTGAQTLARPMDALCLALPCALDDALAPGGCTYGWESRASLVSDILAASGLNPLRATVRVLNDAELTAEAARRDERVTGARVLCLTLGFGPGGALLEATSFDEQRRATQSRR